MDIVFTLSSVAFGFLMFIFVFLKGFNGHLKNQRLEEKADWNAIDSVISHCQETMDRSRELRKNQQDLKDNLTEKEPMKKNRLLLAAIVIATAFRIPSVDRALAAVSPVKPADSESISASMDGPWRDTRDDLKGKKIEKKVRLIGRDKRGHRILIVTVPSVIDSASTTFLKPILRDKSCWVVVKSHWNTYLQAPVDVDRDTYRQTYDMILIRFKIAGERPLRKRSPACADSLVAVINGCKR
ncbi:MAG TPA: hypothetical protein VN420_04235 [Candidatus Fimivivens sp.]|nr:hypothetical protein [Candidatus Fimivivens sp.]